MSLLSLGSPERSVNTSGVVALIIALSRAVDLTRSHAVRTRLRTSAAITTVLLLAAGCGDAASTDNGDKATEEYPSGIELETDFDPDEHFDWAYVSFAPSWDPIESVTGGDISFFEPVYDRLLNQDENSQLIPMLAEEFTPAPDNKSVTLKLRQGLTFSDGTPFDAEAVKFNLERAKGAGSRISGEVAQIASVEVVDPHTVTVNVTGGLGSLLVALSARPGMMVSPTAAQAGTLPSAPVGIGPYVTTELNPGASATYVKSENYWDPDAQNVASMTYRLMTDDQARLNALVSGEIDGASLNPDQLPAAERAGMKVITKPSTVFVYVAVNNSAAPFDNPQVRKAVNMAIDREGISEGLYDGHCTPQIQPFPESSPGYSDKLGDGLDEFPYDPEEAKKILEENGATDLSVRMVVPNVSIYMKLAEVVQDELADVGITAEVAPVPPTQVVQEFGLEKTAQLVVSPFTGINDPDALLGRYLTEKALFNPGGGTNPDILTHGVEGASFVDPEDRTPAYEKMMDAWVEEPPHIMPICMVHLAAGFQPTVSGVYQADSGRSVNRGVAVKPE